jgi:hypothetical protein
MIIGLTSCDMNFTASYSLEKGLARDGIPGQWEMRP